jgi:TolB-like protein
MKISYKWTLGLFCLLMMVQPLWAKEKNVVAVLPFTVNSAENIDYVRQGVADMLSSRVSVSDKIEIVARDLVQAATKDVGGKDLTASDIYALGKRLNADFVVWGSITKIGNNLNIDGKMVDIAANKQTVAIFAQCPSMDDVIPKINEFAAKIETHILGTPAQAFSSAPTAREIIVSRQPAPQTAREAEIISGMRGGKKGTFTASINPDFINAEQPLNKESFWKSPQFPNDFRGIDIGDVNGDGLKETVMIDQNTILIYQRKGTDFRLVQKIQGNSYDNFISLDVADINKNGIMEIIITNYVSSQLRSLVIEFKDGKFTHIATALPWFLRVIDNGSGTPILIGQRRGIEKPFESPIYEIVWQGGQYREGQKMKIPEGLPVYGLNMIKTGGSGSEKIVALNDDDYLCVFQPTDKPLSKVVIMGGSDEFIWKSEDYYGGSNTYIEPFFNSTNTIGEELNTNKYINLRILNYDTNNDGKPEIIIVKNNSASARVFQTMKLFNSAEVYDLEWDGMGMVENWRTKKISGYVADYQFKDIDNDGENEVVLALVLSVGGQMRGRSVVVAYDLKGP